MAASKLRTVSVDPSHFICSSAENFIELNSSLFVISKRETNKRENKPHQRRRILSLATCSFAFCLNHSWIDG